MKFIKLAVGFTLILCGILGLVLAGWEWAKIPFMNGLMKVVIGIMLMGFGVNIIDE